MNYSRQHLQETAAILQALDVGAIDRMVDVLAGIKAVDGRIFFIGIGGSAANCSHAVNDFRKLAGVECYTPTDNVSELTARINDEGWESTFAEWLKISRLGESDALFVLSVGGGSIEKNVSLNLVAAIRHAKSIGAKVVAILGRDGGMQRPLDKFVGRDPRHIHAQIDAIEQWPGDALTVARNARSTAMAFTRAVAKIAAGARVHCGDELKSRRQFQSRRRARDRDGACLEWLAQ